MRLEDKVITEEPSLEALQHSELLFRNGYDTILLAFSLIDEDLLAFKTDVMPFEAASLAHSEDQVCIGHGVLWCRGNSELCSPEHS